MKKLIFALFGALAMASIPLNVNATDSCAISINSGETKTINYATNCRIENHGVLNITSGANINKYTRDTYAAIENYGTLTVSGGSIYADYGYAIRNRGGAINVTGGTINSALHQAIWASAGSVKITGGTLKSAGGYEENVYTTGKLQICGNYSHNPAAKVEDLCPKPAPTPAPAEPATAPATAEPAKATATKATVKTSTATTTAYIPKKTDTTAPTSATTPAPSKTETKAEDKAEIKANDEKQPAQKSEEGDKNNTFLIIIAATLAVLSSATATIVVNRFRD